MDMFNAQIYPRDIGAKEAINRLIELRPHTKDKKYIELLSYHLSASLDEFKPNIVVYNAGTDVLINDRLGLLDITPSGIVRRDEIVFIESRMRNIPIVMLTSGGYQTNNAQVVSNSIINLFEKGLIR
jgi:histone deacetylase 11